MIAVEKEQHAKIMLKSLGRAAILIVLILAVLAGLAFVFLPIDAPSFGAAVWVTNNEVEQIDVRIQSALTDKTVPIQPSESIAFKLFAGDQGAEFSALLRGEILIEVATPNGEVLRSTMPGAELEVSKRAYFIVVDGKIRREANPE